MRPHPQVQGRDLALKFEDEPLPSSSSRLDCRQEPLVGTSLGSYLPIRSTERQICAAVLHCEGACIGGTMQEALTTPATRTRCARTSTGSRRPLRGGRVGPEGGHGAPSSGVPLETSSITPRSRSVARNTNLAPLNSPLRITLFSRSARSTVSSKFGVATAT